MKLSLLSMVRWFMVLGLLTQVPRPAPGIPASTSGLHHCAVCGLVTTPLQGGLFCGKCEHFCREDESRPS